jgi:UDP-N-acetyl-D-glucosamine dehydrogenase
MMTVPLSEKADLKSRIADGSATIGIVGMGYVGLPLARVAAGKGFAVTGFDTDPGKVEMLMRGQSYIRHIPSADLAGLIGQGLLDATTDFSRIRDMNAVLICVPTPLTKHREPDVSYIVSTGEAIAPYLRPGQLVVLESTTYPGTTAEILTPILQRGGLVCGRDVFVAYSPEREDPGNPHFNTERIPKIVGADDPVSLELAHQLYSRLVVEVMPVSSAATAEAVKLTENIFRAVNIALVNELKIIFQSMNIDIWSVIEAAKTKPFGYMPFYPGPGLGGHCIPIDPFYLTWKAREYDIATKFIELAGEINTSMPHYVVQRLALAIDKTLGKGLNGSRIMMVGVAYKKNIDDVRESPAFKLMHLLEERGAIVSYHDPYVIEIPRLREHPDYIGRRSVPLTAQTLNAVDAALVVTDHDGVDYQLIVDSARVVVDTRNATRTVREGRDNVFDA